MHDECHKPGSLDDKKCIYCGEELIPNYEWYVWETVADRDAKIKRYDNWIDSLKTNNEG